MERVQLHTPERIVDVHRQVATIQKVQRTVEITEAQYFDKIVDCARRVPTARANHRDSPEDSRSSSVSV